MIFNILKRNVCFFFLKLQHSSATLQIIGAPSIDQSSFIPMDVFKQLERSQNQQPQIPVQSGVDQTSYISQPDRFAVFDQIQPHRKPYDFGGVDETSLVSMEKIRLLEIPSNLAKQPYDVEEKLQAPTVLTPLQPIDTQEGSPVVLTAKIAGTPMPNVSKISFLKKKVFSISNYIFFSLLGLKIMHH